VVAQSQPSFVPYDTAEMPHITRKPNLINDDASNNLSENERCEMQQEPDTGYCDADDDIYGRTDETTSEPPPTTTHKANPPKLRPTSFPFWLMEILSSWRSGALLVVLP
jgi:hypothetical protein